MRIDYKEVNAALYNRVATDGDGAAVRALVNSVFLRSQLNNVTGRVLPWLVWAPADVPGDSHTMLSIGGSWWAYAPYGNEPVLLDIRSALDELYSTEPLAVAWGRLGITHRGRAIEDRALTALGMETRIGYRRLG